MPSPLPRIAMLPVLWRNISGVARLPATTWFATYTDIAAEKESVSQFRPSSNPSVVLGRPLTPESKPDAIGQATISTSPLTL